MFIPILSVFATVLVSVIALLWLIRMIRIWNGDVKSDDVLAFAFLVATTVGITASILLIRMTISVFAGV